VCVRKTVDRLTVAERPMLMRLHRSRTHVAAKNCAKQARDIPQLAEPAQ
jgi:hypothetical protein